MSENKQAVSQRVKERVFSALPGSRAELCSKLDMPPSTLSFALRQLRADGRIHIGEWKRTANACRPSAVFHAEGGPDASLADRKYEYRKRTRICEREYGDLSPRADPMVWITCGRQPPGMGAR